MASNFLKHNSIYFKLLGAIVWDPNIPSVDEGHSICPGSLLDLHFINRIDPVLRVFMTLSNIV
jgi:hypothetical protein